MRHAAVLTVLLGLVAIPAGGADAPADVAEIASKTFVLGCVAHMGAYDSLRDKLLPGHELYLPRLPEAEAKPFLQGRSGEVYIRPDAGVTMVLIRPDDDCAVFVRRVGAERIYQQVEKDLRIGLGKSFTIRAAGQEAKGPLRSRFIDVVPAGDYRDELKKRYGSEPAGYRTIVTTSESANPDLQAIITIGARQP